MCLVISGLVAGWRGKGIVIMRFHTVKEILDWTRCFHDKLAEDYEQLAEEHERERVGMLLHYLAEHERALGEAIRHYEEDDIHDILGVAFAPDVELPSDLDALCKAPDTIDTASVLALALRFHEALEQVYQKLAETAPSERIKALFENISNHEVKEKLRTVRDAGRLEDV